MDLSGYRLIIVGAGFFGAVIAERAASQLGIPVLVIDRRDHIGGNCYSEEDPTSGIEVHRYGSHIFHTSIPEVWDYVRRFTEFNYYHHCVMTTYKGRVYSVPINLGTINHFYGMHLAPDEARQLLQNEAAREPYPHPENLEEKAISLMGRPLYEAFIRGFTKKQWLVDPKKLPASVITRLPLRWSYNDRYFNDPFEGVPLDGYTKVFERILRHPLIQVALKTDYFDLKSLIPQDTLVVYSGPIDRLLDDRFGKLTWCSVRFEKEVVDVGDFQGTGVMLYADEAVPFTRIHEFKHYHPERREYWERDQSVIFREYSFGTVAGQEPAFPVNTKEDLEKLSLYRAKVAELPNLIVGGRLGLYSYLDMDRVIALALRTFENNIRPRFGG